MASVSSLVLRLAELHGYALIRSRRHLVFRHPTGATVVTASSPSDRRALRNIEARFRRSIRASSSRARPLASCPDRSPLP
jgi:hypothetical protein